MLTRVREKRLIRSRKCDYAEFDSRLPGTSILQKEQTNIASSQPILINGDFLIGY